MEDNVYCETMIGYFLSLFFCAFIRLLLKKGKTMYISIPCKINLMGEDHGRYIFFNYSCTDYACTRAVDEKSFTFFRGRNRCWCIIDRKSTRLNSSHVA